MDIQETIKELGWGNCSTFDDEDYFAMKAWLQKLASYEDKTLITAEWLEKNGFEKRVDKYDFLYCDDCVEICTYLNDAEAGIWEVEVNYLDYYNPHNLQCCTLGQLRMFLAICGLDNIVNELNA